MVPACLSSTGQRVWGAPGGRAGGMGISAGLRLRPPLPGALSLLQVSDLSGDPWEGSVSCSPVQVGALAGAALL